jgi:hypothetical protein
LTRIATCLRNNTPYVVRDIDGRELDRVEAAAIITSRYTIPAEARRRSRVPQRSERVDQTGVDEKPLQVDSLDTNLRA